MFIPEFSKKEFFEQLREYLSELFHDLAGPKESRIEEGRLLQEG